MNNNNFSDVINSDINKKDSSIEAELRIPTVNYGYLNFKISSSVNDYPKLEATLKNIWSSVNKWLKPSSVAPISPNNDGTPREEKRSLNDFNEPAFSVKKTSSYEEDLEKMDNWENKKYDNPSFKKNNNYKKNSDFSGFSEDGSPATQKQIDLIAALYPHLDPLDYIKRTKFQCSRMIEAVLGNNKKH